jgi:hypothetical protein
MSFHKISFFSAVVALVLCAFTNNVFAQSTVAWDPPFYFAGFAPGVVEFALGGSFFEIAPFAPVPEPSTWCAAAIAAAIIGFQLRHRMRAAGRKFIHRLTTLNAKPFQSQAKRGGLHEKRQLLERRL